MDNNKLKRKLIIICAALLLVTIAIVVITVGVLLEYKDKSIAVGIPVSEVPEQHPNINTDTELLIDTELTTEFDSDYESTERLFTEITDPTVVVPNEVHTDSTYSDQAALLLKTNDFAEFIDMLDLDLDAEKLCFINAEIFDEYTMYTYSLNNTDAVLIALLYPGGDIEFLDFANKYGSDYPIVEFTNSVPSNRSHIYDCLLANGIWGTYFITDYAEGETNITLYNIDSDEEIEITL